MLGKNRPDLGGEVDRFDRRRGCGDCIPDKPHQAEEVPHPNQLTSVSALAEIIRNGLAGNVTILDSIPLYECADHLSWFRGSCV
jgi:hypothetical protein